LIELRRQELYAEHAMVADEQLEDRYMRRNHEAVWWAPL
jgi:hypothetical protein